MTEQKILTPKITKLFKKFGIKSVSMDDVAKALGMSKKTLYQLVPDKSKLIEIVFSEEFTFYQSSLETINAHTNDTILNFLRINELLYKFLLDFSPAANYDLEKYEADFYANIKEKYVHAFLNAIRTNLLLGKQQQLYRKELNIDIISKLHLARIEQIPNSKIFKQEEFTSHEFVKEICLYHLHGVLNANGMKLLTKYEHEIDNILKSKTI